MANDSLGSLRGDGYEDRIIAYIDILGFKSIVKGADKALKDYAFSILHSVSELCGEASLVKIFELDSDIFSNDIKAIKRNSQFSVSVPGKGIYAGFLETSNFSDCIVISAPLSLGSEFGEEEGFIKMFIAVKMAVMELYDLLGKKPGSLLIRGAITIGPLYHVKSTIYGEGLVDAYELECTAAIYPRVIISNEVMRRCNQTFGSLLDGRHWPLKPLQISQDSDGFYYIDFLDMPFSMRREKILEWREAIVNTLEQHEKKPALLMKWQWMANYFNQTLKRHQVLNKEMSFMQTINPINLPTTRIQS